MPILLYFDHFDNFLPKCPPPPFIDQNFEWVCFAVLQSFSTVNTFSHAKIAWLGIVPDFILL